MEMEQYAVIKSVLKASAGPRNGCVAVVSLVLMVSLFAAGCRSGEVRRSGRYDEGLVIILPGIEGESRLNRNIAAGLADGGILSAIEIHDWSAGRFLTWFVNLAYEPRNRRIAEELASRIVAYQRQHPGKPVYLIGHSGGGGIAVFVLEALPPGRQVTSAMLLAPALSPTYDLRRALRRTRHGIWNFYSEHDVGFLKVGTTIFGTVDREHASAAGATGFREPPGMGPEGRELYRTRLHQVKYTPRMAKAGHGGGHTGWASRDFAAQWLAPLLYSQREDPGTAYAGAPAASAPAMGGGGAPANGAGDTNRRSAERR